MADLQRETFELSAVFKYLQMSDSTDTLPENIVTANAYKCLKACEWYLLLHRFLSICDGKLCDQEWHA